jgi:signal transduction histidine kinase/CheY-like chemotaxis protein
VVCQFSLFAEPGTDAARLFAADDPAPGCRPFAGAGRRFRAACMSSANPAAINKTIPVIPIIYTFTILLLVFQVFSLQRERRGRHPTPYYINFMEVGAYVRSGFDRADINRVPVPGAGGWKRFSETPREAPLRIVDSGLEDLPQRKLLNFRGNPAREFTLLFAFEMDSLKIEYLREHDEAVPGMYLASIGDNWEIFLNGRLVRSEMHLDETGRIRSGRTWHTVFFPLEKAFFITGTNILSFRIIGDPAYGGTGFYYTGPYYLDDYSRILAHYSDNLLTALCGIYFFVGIYHFMMFLSQRKEIYNLYYSVFSLLLGCYSFMRSPAIFSLIPDTNITTKILYGSLFLLLPLMGAFIESLENKKISPVTSIFGGFCIVLSVTQCVFSIQYAEDVLLLWQSLSLVYILYVFGYLLLFTFIRDGYRRWTEARRMGKPASLLKEYSRGMAETSLGNITIGAAIAFFTGFYDLLDAIFIHLAYNMTSYGLFIFSVGITFSLSRRYNSLFMQIGANNAALELSNTALEAAVYERTRELEKQTAIAESASRAKSDFLAKMSHEIRTPMNAIIGLSELILREKTNPRVREYASGVKQSSVSLLSIINDILDFSKIESGKMEIIPVEYQLVSLINDVVTLIHIRLRERPVLFVTNIDSTLPRSLFGDELRIRQILLNLLSNAAKYTQEGHIMLSVEAEQMEAGAVTLVVTVSDTGIGIQAENIDKIFTDFTQFDGQKNKGVEGTGLGLAITRNLCHAMGGDIAVESEYGMGSRFTVRIPQKVQDSSPLVQIKNAGIGGVLVYEAREIYGLSLRYTLDNLGVPCTLVCTGEAFLEALSGQGDYSFIFTSPVLFDQVKKALRDRKVEAEPVLISGYGEPVPYSGIPLITMPAGPVSTANILNRAKEDVSGREAKNFTAGLIAPDIRVLIVDDIATNIQVAKALLSPYKLKIDTCLNGADAIQAVQKNQYDLILMDHMMPGMDGIETCAAIRAWEKDLRKNRDLEPESQIPIVALTANAVVGMREMFLQNGFSDYLSKPIEIAKLNEIIEKWIRRRKQKT